MKTKHKLPEGYLVRPASMDDLEASVELFNICSRQIIGMDEFTVKEYTPEWLTPGFDLETDTRIAQTQDGQIVACFEVWDVDEPHVMVHCWGRIHPEYIHTGIDAYLLQWAEKRAMQAVSKAPAEARVTLRGATWSLDQAGQDMYQGAGFELIRYFRRMVIPLNGRLTPPEWPEDITVRNFVVGQDERPALHAVIEAFEDHWGYVEKPFEGEYERWMHFMNSDEDFDPSLWFLAMDGEQIVGVSLCRPKITDDPDMGWVDTLGVRRPWRRRGLALALLQHSFDEFSKRDKRRVGLGVDAGSLTGATRLYKKAGMQSDPKHQFSAYEKELRPGADFSTQAVES